jgi:hypothetical protein
MTPAASEASKFRSSASELGPSTSLCLLSPLDDGRMTETCCGNNIRGEEEKLLR